MPLRAQLTFDDALLVLRPAPAGLKGGSVERYAAELDEIDATQGHDPARVRSIEAMDLWLLVHQGIVGRCVRASHSPERPSGCSQEGQSGSARRSSVR